MGIEQTPAILIVQAMLDSMTSDERQKIAIQLVGGAVAGRKAFVEAVTMLQVANMTVGQRYDLDRAIEKLRESERQ